MKKSIKKEPFLQTLARKVGQAVGTIAKATQGAAAGHVAVVKTDSARVQTTKSSKRRSTSKNSKKKSVVAKAAPRKARPRTSSSGD
jgi:hypothetical protein